MNIISTATHININHKPNHHIHHLAFIPYPFFTKNACVFIWVGSLVFLLFVGIPDFIWCFFRIISGWSFRCISKFRGLQRIGEFFLFGGGGGWEQGKKGCFVRKKHEELRWMIYINIYTFIYMYAYIFIYAYMHIYIYMCI